MATITDEVVIKIKIATEKATAALKVIREKFKGLGASIVKQAKRAVVALVGLTAALGAMVVSTAKTGDEIAKMSKRLNISTEDLSALRFQAGLAGTDFRAAATGIRFMTKAMFDSTQGLETAQRGFDILGITVTKTDGKLKDAQDIFLEISDALADMEDGTEKTAAAQLLFGSRMGTQLIPLLNQGSEALREQAEEARKLGIIFDEEAARKSEVLVDSMLRFRKVIEGVKNEIAFGLIPKVSKYLLILKDWILANKQLLVQRVDQSIKILVSTIKELVGWFGRLTDFVRRNSELIIGFSVLAAIAATAAASFSIITGNLPGLTASLVVLKTALLALGGAWAIDKIAGFNSEFKKIDIENVKKVAKTFKEDLKLSIDEVNESFKKLEGTIKNMPERFKAAGEAGKKAADEAKSAWEKTSEGVKNAFEALGLTTKAQFDQQAQGLIDQFKTITQQEQLTDQQLIGLREQLFKKLGELADQAEAADVLGFDPDEVKAELDALHEQLIDSVITFEPEIVKAGNTTIATAKKIQQSQFEIARNTIESLRDVFDNSFQFQVDKFSSLKDQITSYQDVYITAEEEITEAVVIEVERREEILTRFFINAEGKLARLKEGFAGVGGTQITGSESPLPFFVEGNFAKGINRVPSDMIARIHKDEQIVSANQNPFNPNNTVNNNQQFIFNNNGNGNNGVIEQFAAQRFFEQMALATRL